MPKGAVPYPERCGPFALINRFFRRFPPVGNGVAAILSGVLVYPLRHLRLFSPALASILSCESRGLWASLVMVRLNLPRGLGQEATQIEF